MQSASTTIRPCQKVEKLANRDIQDWRATVGQEVEVWLNGRLIALATVLIGDARVSTGRYCRDDGFQRGPVFCRVLQGLALIGEPTFS